MRHLPEELLEIYTKFMQGHFVVKQRNRLFDAVAVDMKLEQIIEQFHKSIDAIMGQTRQNVSPNERILITKSNQYQMHLEK